MIKELSLATLPCFDADGVLPDLATINYVFGPNGSGKTTISQHLAEFDPAIDTTITWRGPQNTIRVYNRNYVRSTFTKADGEESGVFLLGEDSRETLERIERLEKELEDCREKIDGLNKTRARLEEERTDKRSNVAEVVWRKRECIPSVLKDRMTGLNASKTQCLNKAIEVFRSNPDRGTETLSGLADKAVTAFDDTTTEAPLIPAPPSINWDEMALSATLDEPIVSSADVRLSEMIERLKISDWVREGVGHLHRKDNSEGLCPFCQQAVPETLEKELASLFDETYRTKRKAVVEFQQKLRDAEKEFDEFRAKHSDQLEVLVGSDDAPRAFRALELAIARINSSLQQKELKPSKRIQAHSVASDYARLLELVDAANQLISEKNSIISDRRKQQDTIIQAAWREFARGAVGEILKVFDADDERTRKGLNGVNAKLGKHNVRAESIGVELGELRRSTTSSAQAIDDINRLLTLSLFHSFELAPAITKSDGYRIIRDDGKLAEVDTLSEGERTFVTFLYFYHSLFDLQRDGETDKLTVVIDDPVSSLDGDVMFVVSTLIRRLIRDIRRDAHERVGQSIVLTHNTRFHHELCYQHQGERSPEVKFYRIRKFSPKPSIVEDCGERNPVRTAYQELWDEVATAESQPDASMPWLPNVLRRILESYFTTLGGRRDLYSLGEDLPINEKMLHDALIAWTHSGSHTIVDADIYAQPLASNERWLEAFGGIFQNSSGGAHYGHYEMMIHESRKHLQGGDRYSTAVRGSNG